MWKWKVCLKNSIYDLEAFHQSWLPGGILVINLLRFIVLTFPHYIRIKICTVWTLGFKGNFLRSWSVDSSHWFITCLWFFMWMPDLSCKQSSTNPQASSHLSDGIDEIPPCRQGLFFVSFFFARGEFQKSWMRSSMYGQWWFSSGKWQ